MEKTLEVLNRLEAAGLIGRYAIRRRSKPKQLAAVIMSAIPGSGISRTLGAIELL